MSRVDVDEMFDKASADKKIITFEDFYYVMSKGFQF